MRKPGSANEAIYAGLEVAATVMAVEFFQRRKTTSTTYLNLGILFINKGDNSQDIGDGGGGSSRKSFALSPSLFIPLYKAILQIERATTRRDLLLSSGKMAVGKKTDGRWPEP